MSCNGCVSSAHGIMLWIQAEMERRRFSHSRMAKESGVSRTALAEWRRTAPGIYNVEAVLGVLGVELALRQKKGALREVLSELEVERLVAEATRDDLGASRPLERAVLQRALRLR